MLSYHTLSCCWSSYLMMPLEFLISFVLPLQVVFGGAGEGGESGEGRPRKKISGFKEIFTCGKTFTHAQLQLPVPYPKRASKLQWTHTFIANPTRNAFQRGKKGRKHHLEKKFKTSKEGFFTEEEVNYDNYSDW